MDDHEHIRDGLAAAVGGARRGRTAADRLCLSFVELLHVDGAALALTIGRDAISSALATSGPLAHDLIELQFMLGEGPCAESATSFAPVMADDLNSVDAARWTMFSGAASRLGVRAVFALPILIAGISVGAVFLYRTRAGPLNGADLAGAFLAADLAALTVLDVMWSDLDADVDDETGGAWSELASLARAEVYQAAGVLIVQLGVTPPEALVRLRAYAYASGKTTSQAAFDIMEHRVRLEDDRTGDRPEEGE